MAAFEWKSWALCIFKLVLIIYHWFDVIEDIVLSLHVTFQIIINDKIAELYQLQEIMATVGRFMKVKND